MSTLPHGRDVQMAICKMKPSKLLLLVHPPKGGSHYFDPLFTANLLYQHEIPPHEPLGKIFFATFPCNVCPYYFIRTEKNAERFLSPESRFLFEAYVAHVGGNYTRNKKQMVSSPQWTSDQITDWCSEFNIQIFHIIRDGRDQLASLKKHIDSYGGLPITLEGCQNAAYFFRDKVRAALNCRRRLNFYRILPFEKLVIDPLSVIYKIRKLTGIPLDIERIKQIIPRLIPNSSFRDIGIDLDSYRSSFNPKDIAKRREYLPVEWRKCFEDIAGKELEQLSKIKI
jgi:hypothetical protein